MPSDGDGPLAIVGNLNADLWIRTVHRFPNWDEEVLADSARLELAGTAGYLMLAAKGMGIEAVTVSTVGDDGFGRFVRERVQNLGFSTAGVETLPGEETSLGMVFVGEGGRRGILSTLGAHRYMDMDVVRHHDGQIAACSTVFLCGNYLLPALSPVHVADYARTVRARGQTVVFDPSWDPSGWGDRTREGTYRLLTNVDVYMPNEEELIHLTGKTEWRDALREIEGLPTEVVVKRGDRGAVYARDREWQEAPALAVNAVNTIGAGDVFDVGYLYGKRKSWAPHRRLQFACALAAMVVSQAGTRVYPHAAAVAAFLEERTDDASWHEAVA